MPDRRPPSPDALRDARSLRGARTSHVRGAVTHRAVGRACVLAPLVVGLVAAPLVTLPAEAAAVRPTTTPAPSGTAACDPDGPERLIPATPRALTALGADEAHRVASGAGVVVAVVDSGVDARNSHLAGAVVAGADLVGPGDGRDDADGHGTAVAGIVAARPVTGSGVVGLALGATVLPVRVYDRRTGPDGVRTDRIAQGVRWAVAHGADIVNVSLSSASDDPELRAAVGAAVDAGVLVVASAGNGDDARTDRYPAAYPGVLGVVATDAAGRPVATGPAVDVAAPGGGVVTTFHAVGDCALDGPAQASWATAYVSATAALLAERFPAEGADAWARRVVEAAHGSGDVPVLDPAAAVRSAVADGTPAGTHAPGGEVLGAATADPVRPRPVWPWWVLGAAALLLGLRAARRPAR